MTEIIPFSAFSHVIKFNTWEEISNLIKSNKVYSEYIKNPEIKNILIEKFKEKSQKAHQIDNYWVQGDNVNEWLPATQKQTEMIKKMLVKIKEYSFFDSFEEEMTFEEKDWTYKIVYAQTTTFLSQGIIENQNSSFYILNLKTKKIREILITKLKFPYHLGATKK